MPSNIKGEFEQFFETRPRVEADFWRARLFAGVAYYGERTRTMLRDVKRAKTAAGADPFAFIERFEKGIAADYERRPAERQTAAIAWVERLEALNGEAQSFIAGGE